MTTSQETATELRRLARQLDGMILAGELRRLPLSTLKRVATVVMEMQMLAGSLHPEQTWRVPRGMYWHLRRWFRSVA